MCMKNLKVDVYRLPAMALFGVGLMDIVRGFLHTFLLSWSAATFAKFDLATVPEDQVFMLGVFGISNFLTGFIYILISTKAKNLSPYILALIPAAYLLGLIGINLSGIHSQAEFLGKYFMMIYFAVCIVTFVIFLVKKRNFKG